MDNYYYIREFYVFDYTFIENPEKSGYMWEPAGPIQKISMGPDYDPDFITYYDYIDKMCETKYNTIKVIFENNEWKCTEDCYNRLSMFLIGKRYDKDITRITKQIWAVNPDGSVTVN